MSTKNAIPVLQAYLRKTGRVKYVLYVAAYNVLSAIGVLTALTLIAIQLFKTHTVNWIATIALVVIVAAFTIVRYRFNQWLNTVIDEMIDNHPKFKK